jgi:hypothetical protein
LLSDPGASVVSSSNFLKVQTANPKDMLSKFSLWRMDAVINAIAAAAFFDGHCVEEITASCFFFAVSFRRTSSLV